MIIKFSEREIAMLQKLKFQYGLPAVPTDWDYETSELYRDAANDYLVTHGLDENYAVNYNGEIAEIISDKLFEVE